MKKLIFKQELLILTAICLLSFSVKAQEVTKEFRKEFTTNKNTTVDLANKYGNIIITSWDSDKVDIYVKITIDLPDRSRAEKLINLIDVAFDETADRISARTVIDEKFSFSGWGGTSRKFNINYTVKMPNYCGLDMVNRYGNADIDELRGRVNLDIKYGNLNITKLTRTDEKPLNRIAIAYGKGLIKEAGWLDLYLRYASMVELPLAKAILTDSRYSKFKAGELSSLVGISKYDNYSIEKINNLVLEIGYTTLNVDKLEKKLNLEGSYGSVNVTYVPAGFESAEINTRYTGVRVGIDESASYRIEGKTSYSSIKFDEEKFRVQKRIVNNTSSEIEGIIGKEESPSSIVKISTSYGSVRLY
ncbi:MAG: hypothetical protein ACUVTX_04325 [Bacteroidales bacterium]